jgi:hypothetical protein
MGGLGSGRRGWRLRAEQLSRVDVRWLARRRMLSPGRYWLNWSRGEERSGSATLMVRDDFLTLSYRWRDPGDEWQEMSHRIQLEHTRCHFGGRRPWMRCPRCGRRVAVLYIAGAPTGCRRCLNVAYESQCEDEAGRAQLMMQKVERKLMSLDRDALHRPPRMRQRTFDILCDRYDAAEARWLLALGRRLRLW